VGVNVNNNNKTISIAPWHSRGRRKGRCTWVL